MDEFESIKNLFIYCASIGKLQVNTCFVNVNMCELVEMHTKTRVRFVLGCSSEKAA